MPAFSLSMFPQPLQVIVHKRYVSIDALSLHNSSITPIPFPCDTVYASEFLCIVLRSKQGGLVSTDLILWKGRYSLSSEVEGKKIKELEGRYRTQGKEVKQGCESEDLVWALGGRLVVRLVSLIRCFCLQWLTCL